MVTIIEKQPTLRLASQRGEVLIDKLEKEHPDEWLLIEVTKERNGQPHVGKLIATAVDDMELIELGQQYDRKKISTFITHGSYHQPLPEVVA